MSILGSLVGYFVCKALLHLLFYSKQWERLLKVTLFTSLAVVPLITMLYHETGLNFWYVYTGMIVADVFICYNLLQKSGLKALLSSFFSNSIAIVFFFMANG